VAHWRHADSPLCAKLVYYGPALGGKTTKLRSLHRITDPEGVETLLSVNTAADRTPVFDLLPFDLGTILGYEGALRDLEREGGESEFRLVVPLEAVHA
jgi:hypothetical protein